MGVGWLKNKAFEWSDKPTPARNARDLLCTLLLMVVATLVGFVFHAFDMEACIVITYVLAVLCASLLTVGRVHCLFASAVSVLLYNYLFTTPRFSLTAWGTAYPATFAVMFVVGFVASAVAMSLRSELHASRVAYNRTRVILDADEALRRCTTHDQVIEAACERLSELLGVAVVWYAGSGVEPSTEKDDVFCARRYFFSGGAIGAEGQDQSHGKARAQGMASGVPVIELPMARRALEDGTCVGVGTDLFPSASGLYLPLFSGKRVIGVMGICLMGRAPFPAERNEAEAVVGEASLACDRVQALEERERAAVMAKNEQLRANLLRSISHDLRTPLTAISGNVDVLLSNGDALGEAARESLLKGIRSDATWLNSTVENLLAITRLENGGMSLATTAELLDDIVEEALRHVNPDVSRHKIAVEPSQQMLLVDVDARLVVQVVVNLVNNAIIHTPEGSHIHISSCSRDGMAVLRVTDDGPGIAAVDRAHVFESFYTAGHALADSKRSVGLGLALCKSIVEAHGGAICLEPVEPHGCWFEFTLPLYDLEGEEREDGHGGDK